MIDPAGPAKGRNRYFRCKGCGFRSGFPVSGSIFVGSTYEKSNPTRYKSLLAISITNLSFLRRCSFLSSSSGEHLIILSNLRPGKSPLKTFRTMPSIYLIACGKCSTAKPLRTLEFILGVLSLMNCAKYGSIFYPFRDNYNKFLMSPPAKLTILKPSSIFFRVAALASISAFSLAISSAS